MKLLIYDFDGTLCHTAPGIYKAIRTTLDQLGYPSFAYEEVMDAIATGLEPLLGKLGLIDGEDEEKTQELIRVFRAEYDKEYMEGSELFPGAAEQILSWEGQVAIASNKNVNYIHKILAESELRNVNWTGIIGGDQVTNKKPDPEMVLSLLEAAQVEKHEAVMIGDTYADVLAAKNAGIASIGVTFGYSNPQKLLDLGVTKLIDSFHAPLPLSELHQ